MRYSQQQKKEALEAYASEMTLEESGALVGASAQTVLNWAKSAGVARTHSESKKILDKKGRGRSHGKEVWKEIERRYSAGENSVEIAKELDLKQSMVIEVVVRAGLVRTNSEAQLLIRDETSKRFRVHDVDEETFEKPLSEDTAWLLGVIFGDGCIVRHKSRIRGLEISGDQDVCENAARIMSSSAPIFLKGNTSILRISSFKLAESLGVFGVVPNKSNIIEWPDLPLRLESHFVRGLIDSDGSIDDRSIRFGVTSKCFVESFLDVVERETGFRPALGVQRHKNPKHADLWKSSVYSDNAVILGSWIWKGSSRRNRSDRKYRQFVKLRERAARTSARKLD